MAQKIFRKQNKLDKENLELGTELAPRFADDGLIPCITVDASSKDVLMFAWMNREALYKTIETGKATYYSRSREKLWVKGESSGRTQAVEQILVDCDQDVIQLRVHVKGEGTCHNGYKSCFYRALKKDTFNELEYVIKEQSFDPDKVYSAEQ